MRVFLDSNVILSGLISDKGAPRIILDLLSLKLTSITGLTGEYNIIEIERNLKKKLPSAIRQASKTFYRSPRSILSSLVLAFLYLWLIYI